MGAVRAWQPGIQVVPGDRAAGQAAIVELPFDEGASVARGTVLARVDDRLYQQQVGIDRANEQVASAQVAVNESSLIAARSSVDSDRFDLAEKQRDAARAEELVRTAATSVQTRDLTLTAANQSAAALAVPTRANSSSTFSRKASRPVSCTRILMRALVRLSRRPSRLYTRSTASR